MSLGYADRLKQRKNLGGQLGAKEYHQSFDDIKAGVQSLAEWVSEAQRVFVFTGAGISTSCGIPDFRGPKGIWTLRKKKAPLPSDFTPFEYAKPSFTHMAISALVAAGKVPYVCSQNVDSLHLRSGVPRSQLAELHGNCFAERCSTCRTEYERDFQLETVDFKPSGRLCTRPGCAGALRDNILDWDTALPEDELEQAIDQAEEADLALVLGTSLQIQPANEIPILTRDEGGKLVIVNLQKTPKDRKANLILRSRVDLVMALLMTELGMQVPPYIRTEKLVVEHTLSCDNAAGPQGGGVGRTLTVRVGSRHGRGCPLPMIESLAITVAADGEHGADETMEDAPAAPAAEQPTHELGRGRNQTSLTAAVAGEGGVAASSSGGSNSTADVSGTKTESCRQGPSATGATDGVTAHAARSAVDHSGRSWSPTTCSSTASEPTTAYSDNCGSGSGGDFVFSFPAVPEWVLLVRCTLQVRLVKWADADKRDVTLRHTVRLDKLAVVPPTGPTTPVVLKSESGSGSGESGLACGGSSPAGGSSCPSTHGDAGVLAGVGGAPDGVDRDGGRQVFESMSKNKTAQSPTIAADGDDVSGHLPPGSVVYSFVSQRLQYDPADIVAAFLADPPQVVVPGPPRKRKANEASEAVAAARQPTRVSQRLRRASERAASCADVGASGTSSDVSGDEDDGEESG